ncbi:putative ADP-ribosyl glycohydrolase [Tupanvirus soda lake]|uniref:ADP-ribosyl glycohydrolase n=2 Tax=Tupanvirus TaxID=2094720 RepID=A0AC62AAY2_9VIRU|nr:putative ADP-ribosyl glycohydrolase [Tupanvirus soda lake]QKU34937.1 putative ADP-ribosyl glycohydrolase [Tupanvirus soda lake]
MEENTVNIKLRARGCILGAMIGDSLGSTLEFTNTENAKKILVRHKNFENGLVGKGPFNLVPGQVTDDSELALAIMSVISTKGKYDQELVAQAYHDWYNSNPFDIGTTTQNAVSEKNAKNMIAAAKSLNSTSMSNGFLMRIFGLVALYHDKPYADLSVALRDDVTLTHGNTETIDIAIFYGMLLWGAIQGSSADELYKWGKNSFIHSPLIVALYNSVENNMDYFVYKGKTYKYSQIDSAICGFVGFALWLVIRCLRTHTSYKNAIIDVVSLGGDTDTNACIVGAIMGALYHYTIPRIWISDLVMCNAPSRFEQYPNVKPSKWLQWLP